MHCSLTSRKLGRTLTFSRPGTAYVYVDINNQPGTRGQQICEGGYAMGDTLTFRGDDAKAFAHLCRRWYRAYIQDAV